jgi:hypothetical protein
MYGTEQWKIPNLPSTTNQSYKNKQEHISN